MQTRNFGGFELLSLTDYTGQSTATVGILDAMFESKGFITPENFRLFCNAVVPLFRAKRIWKNTEILTAELDLYDYGEMPVENPVFQLKIYIEEKQLKSSIYLYVASDLFRPDNVLSEESFFCKTKP